ncbi:MAG: hypothetical protein RL556_400 [Actinomycetota bacterium]|jgi:two-component sensor histidine kinase
MATPAQLITESSDSSAQDIDWINLLFSEWQLIADLVIADLVLWTKTRDGKFIAISHARPSGAATIFYRDINGQEARRDWAEQINKAFETGEIIEPSAPDNYDGVQTRVSAIPVRRRASMNQEIAKSEPIAVITRHANLSNAQTPHRSQLSFTAAGNDLLRMVSEASFPDLGNPTGAKRGAPRANDGLLRLDVNGKVIFASPNGLSAFNKLGIQGELEGKTLAEPVTKLLNSQHTVDESLPLVITGKAPWRSDVESRSTTISLRSIPLKANGERIGALILCRDVTEVRRSEQELITKDATIREIHHRVKNNLQTVASLLRMQGRRTETSEAKVALEQAMRRVQAIAMVHDTLSSGFSQDLNFDEVFDRVLSVAGELAQTNEVSIRTVKDGRFGQLSSNVATPLAVVLTELVGNAVEHGFSEKSGVIHVVAERANKKLVISVSDNGKGLTDGKIGNGLGTTIIKTLVEGELKGSINWFSPVEGGTKATITIPL